MKKVIKLLSSDNRHFCTGGVDNLLHIFINIVYSIYMINLFDQIYPFILRQTGKNKEALKRKSRSNDLLFPRILFSYTAHKCGISNVAIAKELGMNHTSIIYHLKKAETLEHIKEVYARFDSSGVIEKRLEANLNKRYLPSKYRGIYDRYDGKCVVCGFDSVIEVCHIVSRYLGGSDALDNLIILCPNHHAMFDRGLLILKDIHIK